jgi:hypothetical protein
VLTIEMSITTTTMLAQQIASTRRRRPLLSPSAVVSVDVGAVMASTLGFRACSKSKRRTSMKRA